MSTIAIKGSSVWSTGIKSFSSLDTSFSSLKKTSGGLTTALGDLITKINAADKAIDGDTCSKHAEQAKARDEAKHTSMTIAYDKLNELISKAETVDNNVAEKINFKQDAFYMINGNLKPNNKKSFGEKISDWCKKNITTIITVVTVAIVIIAAVAICIICSPAIIAAMAIAATVLGLVYTVVNMGVKCVTGKGIPDLLEPEHKYLASIVRGLDWGLTFVSIILPAGASIKISMLIAEKSFLQTSKFWFKTSFKSFWGSIKKSCKGIKNFFTKNGDDVASKSFSEKIISGIKDFFVNTVKPKISVDSLKSVTGVLPGVSGIKSSSNLFLTCAIVQKTKWLGLYGTKMHVFDTKPLQGLITSLSSRGFFYLTNNVINKIKGTNNNT